MSILRSPLQKARDDLAHAEAELARWQSTLTGHHTTLAELEATMGADALAATEPAEVDAIQERLARTRSSIDVATAAVGAAEGAVVDARRQVLAAAAGVVRDRAKTLRSEADRHAARSRKLLAELAEHDGIDYQPVAFVSGVAGAGGWHRITTPAEAKEAEAAALEAFTAELSQASLAPVVDPDAVRRLVAKADPTGPEAQAVADRHAAAVEEADAWRSYTAAIEAGKRAWLADRADELLADEKRGLSVVQATDMAAAEWRAQIRKFDPKTAVGFSTWGPDQIDAWALEQLGVPVHRPDVLVGA